MSNLISSLIGLFKFIIKVGWYIFSNFIFYKIFALFVLQLIVTSIIKSSVGDVLEEELRPSLEPSYFQYLSNFFFI